MGSRLSLQIEQLRVPYDDSHQNDQRNDQYRREQRARDDDVCGLIVAASRAIA